MLEEMKDECTMAVMLPGVNFEALQLVITYMYQGQVSL